MATTTKLIEERQIKVPNNHYGSFMAEVRDGRLSNLSQLFERNDLPSKEELEAYIIFLKEVLENME